MRAMVHAQIALHDGTRRVYRVPFGTVTEARRYVRGYFSPEKAVIVTARRVERYVGRSLVGAETLG